MVRLQANSFAHLLSMHLMYMTWARRCNVICISAVFASVRLQWVLSPASSTLSVARRKGCGAPLARGQFFCAAAAACAG